MGKSNNIDIIIDGQYHLDYESPESLGIKFNRKVDDQNDLTKRFGDFSYSFSVPKTKNNSLIFKHPEAIGRQKMFYGQKYDCLVLNNTKVLIDGVIELVGMSQTTYDVVIHSKLNDFIDAVGDLELRDITTLPPIENFNYEQTIVDWINADYANSDEAVLQFPFIFYNTVYCPTSVFTGKTDNRGIQMYKYDVYQNNYYAFNTVYAGRYNEFYYHQMPPAIYMLRILEGCVNTVGWQLGGSWIQKPENKMIICPFVGDSDIYDRALVTGTTGVTLPTLRPELFLPEGMKIMEFISSIINTFNLYFKIIPENKTIVLEDWNTMFYTQENPYLLDNLIDSKSIKWEKPDNANPSIQFKDMKKNNDDVSKGEFIMGDNMVLSNNSDSAASLTWQKCTNKQANNFWNYIGTDDDIEVEFGTPRVKRMFLWNDYDIAQNYDAYGAQTIFIPSISKQNVVDNGGKEFNKNDAHTKIYNTEDTIQYKGEMCLYYYYGRSSCDVVNKTGKNELQDYLYITLTTGTTFVKKYTKIGFASPFMLSTYRDNVNKFLANLSSGSTETKDIITCTYLQSLYTMFKRDDNDIPTTPYSLIFDSDNTYHETLYTYYHAKKYERMQKSVILSANIFIDENDWVEMEINRPLRYRGEIYHLVELMYDPIKRTGTIKMIKDL